MGSPVHPTPRALNDVIITIQNYQVGGGRINPRLFRFITIKKYITIDNVAKVR